MANKPITTAPVTMGRHGRLREEEAERAKGVTFDPPPEQEADMARPKSDQQNARHEEDALRTQAVSESRQKEMDQNRGSKEAIDPNPVPASDLERAQAARQAAASAKAKDTASAVTFGEPHAPTAPKTGDISTAGSVLNNHFKIDPTPEPAAKKAPTAKEINEQVNEEIRPKDGFPGHGNPKPDPLLGLSGSIMRDDVQSVLSDLYAHNDLGEAKGHIVQVKVGGGFIEIDINKLNKCKDKIELRTYIASLLVL